MLLNHVRYGKQKASLEMQQGCLLSSNTKTHSPQRHWKIAADHLYGHMCCDPPGFDYNISVLDRFTDEIRMNWELIPDADVLPSGTRSQDASMSRSLTDFHSLQWHAIILPDYSKTHEV